MEQSKEKQEFPTGLDCVVENNKEEVEEGDYPISIRRGEGIIKRGYNKEKIAF